MRKKLFLSFALSGIFTLISLTILAQNKTITGTVLDNSGAKVAGASVVVKGSNLGTNTDVDGKFSLTVPTSAQTLIISFVGFTTQEIVIGSGPINVTMKDATNRDLNEVVVVGYGTARRKDLTGSVATIRERDFNKGVFTAPDQLIQGKAAGVLVLNNTGQPGGSTTVRIRGTSSIRSGNQPLFVVDGVPLSGGSARPGGEGSGAFGNDGGNPLNFMNPNDIANIEILKDASATAIYGSRGANGVVLITTKRGQSGVPQADVLASASASNVLKKLEVLSGDEYRKKLGEYGLSGGDFGESEDAWDAITRTGITQNYSVAVGGGQDGGKYRLSAGYLDQQGVIETSQFKKYTANLTTQFKFLESKKLSLDINLLTTQTNEKVAPVSAFVGFEGNLISQALQWNPTHKLRKPDGSIWIDPAVGSTTINPLAELDYYDDRVKVNSVLASLSPAYKITDALEYRFLYSVNRQTGLRKGQVNRDLNLQGIEGRGTGFAADREQTNQQITNTVSYNKQITPAFNLNAVAGHEWLIFDTRNSFAAGQDFPNVGLNYYDFLGYSTQTSRTIGSFRSPTTELQSFFARAIVNYNDKYLLTATFRADGSTRFGKNHKYGYFPSVGFAWNATNEQFMKDNDFINNLKLRLSWGKTGNQEFPSGASLNRFRLNQQSIAQINYGNEDLKWETSTTSNIGVDFSILNNKIFGSVDYFYKKTTDVLFEQNIVQPAPGGKIWINLPGYVLNKGVELMLGTGIISKEDLQWNVNVNAAFLDNTVEGLAGFYETGELRGQGFSNVRGQRLISGQPLNVWYLRRFEGIDKSTGQSIYTDEGNTLFYSGSPNPKTLLGISTDISYKKFSAVINMNGTFGHYLFNNTAASVLGIGNLGTRNVAKSLFDSDVKESISNAPAPSTRNLEKGNYLKMANASLYYRIGNIGKDFRNVSISLTGQNLFVITNYTGFDPEVNTDAGVDGIPSLGVEYIPYPSSRTILLGVSFSL